MLMDLVCNDTDWHMTAEKIVPVDLLLPETFVSARI